MPTIEENKACWDVTYAWSESGAEWSAPWGGATQQWYSLLLPRLHPFLPTGTILEIAPGFGRWTEFLHPHGRALIGVDLAEKCVQACRERFRDRSHLSFHANDGRSLPMVESASVDFAFSFDSLVHADEAAIYDYLKELARVPRPGAKAFLHHSNLGAYLNASGEPLMPLKETLHEHGRDRTMTAEKFCNCAVAEGLKVASQELLVWGNVEVLIDCISVIAKPPADVDETKHERNVEFMQEAGFARRIAELYGLPASAIA